MKNVNKEGQVKSEFDKDIGKHAVIITGTSASNYLQVPKSKNLGKDSLGIVAKYVSGFSALFWRTHFKLSDYLSNLKLLQLYVQLKLTEGSTCVMHFDIKVNDAHTVRLSLSNSFKGAQVSDSLIKAD